MSELRPTDEYKDLFDNAPCGYLTMGPDGRITKVNATLTTWTGLEADKFISASSSIPQHGGSDLLRNPHRAIASDAGFFQ
jgi:PAS domain-containing protein